LLNQVRNYCVYNELPLEIRKEYFDRVVGSYFTVLLPADTLDKPKPVAPRNDVRPSPAPDDKGSNAKPKTQQARSTAQHSTTKTPVQKPTPQQAPQPEQTPSPVIPQMPIDATQPVHIPNNSNS
jgi:hypothetical protein